MDGGRWAGSSGTQPTLFSLGAGEILAAIAMGGTGASAGGRGSGAESFVVWERRACAPSAAGRTARTWLSAAEPCCGCLGLCSTVRLVHFRW